MRKKFTLAVSASMLAGCATLAPQQVTPASQPATNASPTPVAAEAVLKPGKVVYGSPPEFHWPGGGNGLMEVTTVNRGISIAPAGQKSMFGKWKVVTSDPAQIRRIAYRINRSKAVNLEGGVEFRFGINDMDYGGFVGLYRVAIAEILGSAATYNAYTELSLQWLPAMESVGKDYYLEASGTPSRDAIGSTISIDVDIVEVIRRETKEVYDPTVAASKAEGEVLTVVAP